MKRVTTLIGIAALLLAACGANASPTSTPAPAAPTAAPTATPAPTSAPTAATVPVHVAFDGQKCTYTGPAVVPRGATLVWTFENTPVAIADSTRKGAKSLGSDLVVMPVRAGTTWDTVVASRPAPDGTKGDWPDPAWALADGVEVVYGPSASGVTTATAEAYVVMCNMYWNYDTGTPFAFYAATMLQVLKG